MGSEVTTVKVKGKWEPMGVTVDEKGGRALTADGLEGEDAGTLKEGLPRGVEGAGGAGCEWLAGVRWGVA